MARPAIGVEDERARVVSATFAPGAPPLGLHRIELGSRLFPIPHRVVGAEWNLLAARQQKLLAAFHEILLVEGPRAHEILERDHDHALGDVANGQAVGEYARLARERALLNRFRRAGDRARSPQ